MEEFWYDEEGYPRNAEAEELESFSDKAGDEFMRAFEAHKEAKERTPRDEIYLNHLWDKLGVAEAKFVEANDKLVAENIRLLEQYGTKWAKRLGGKQLELMQKRAKW